MTKDVIVSVKGLHTMESNDEDNVELIAAGTMREENGQFFVEYEEVDPENQEITNVVLIAGEGHLEIYKTGEVEVNLVFEENQKTNSCYHTPFGELMMGIDTNKMKIVKTEDALAIVLQYSLEINYNYVTESNITIKVVSAKC